MGRSWRLYSRKRESRRGATTKTARKGDTTVVERQHGLVDEGNFVTVVTVRARKQANRITLGGRGRFLTVDLPPDTPRHCSLGYGGQGSTRGDIRNEVSLSLCHPSRPVSAALKPPLCRYLVFVVSSRQGVKTGRRCRP